MPSAKRVWCLRFVTVRPVDRTPVDTDDPAYLSTLVDLGRSLGLDRIGVTDASILDRARTALVDRVDRGLSDTMGFTFRNPERSTDPQRAVDGARSVIVAARSYNLPDQDVDHLPLQARVARYAQVDQYTPLRRALQVIARRLRADGHRAVVFADENDLVDREVAHRAGLGWFGRNANLLLPGGGSFFSLGSVVTTARLPTASRVVPDGCGSCRQCIDDCPTAAIVDDGVIDARRCLAWLVQKPGVFPVEYRVALGDRIYGCDACQTGCPPNLRLADRFRARSSDVEASVPGARVDLMDILDADDSTLLDRFGAWYLADRDPLWLRRNALVILANVAPLPVDDRVRGVLCRYLSSDNPVLCAHAVWAARRLGCDDLVNDHCDPNPIHDIVRIELSRSNDEVGRRR